MRSASAGKSRRSGIIRHWHACAPVLTSKSVPLGPEVTGTKRRDPDYESNSGIWDYRLSGVGARLSLRAGEADGAEKHSDAGPEQNFIGAGHQRHGEATHSCALDDFARCAARTS